MRPGRRPPPPPPIWPVPVAPFFPYGPPAPLPVSGLVRPLPAPLPPPQLLPPPTLPPNYRPIYVSAALPNNPLVFYPPPPVIIPRNAEQDIKADTATATHHSYNNFIQHHDNNHPEQPLQIAPTANANDFDRRDHPTAAAEVNDQRNTHIDLYANLDNGQNILEAQTRTFAQYQAPKSETRDDQKQRVQNQIQKPYVTTAKPKYSISNHDAATSASAPQLLPQTHVQYF